MTKFKTIALIAVLIASVAASLLIHVRSESASRIKTALLQQQSQQLAALQTEQTRLSNAIAHATNAPAASHSAELEKLRTQVDALKKQTNELAKNSKPRPTPRASSESMRPEDHPPEYWVQWRALQGTKAGEARDIASAIYEYADEHHGQVPSNLDQITSYLAKNQRVISGTNRFEIIYQGSLDQLQGIPETSVAVVRDTQTWLTPDGHQARVYGMAPGIGQTITSDDNFQSWEAEHVIAAPATSKPAR